MADAIWQTQTNGEKHEGGSKVLGNKISPCREFTAFYRIRTVRRDFCLAALYGVLFPRDKEAAFANYRMWESLGFVIAFAYSTFLCLEYKLYIVLAVLLLTAVTYPIVEYHEHKNPTPPVEQSDYQAHKEAVEADGKVIINQTQL